MLKVKIFTSNSATQLERDMNAFLHPIKGARIGFMQLVVTDKGMSTDYSAIVQYIDMDEDPDENEVQIDK